MNGLNRRYGSLLDLVMPDAKYAAVAAICNPKYKMRWVPPNNRESLRTLFVQCAQCFCESALSPEELGQGSDDDDYMVSMKTSTTLSMPAALKLKFQRTDADRSLSMLDKYPVVTSTFIYYNTTIPSSAPVETFQLGEGPGGGQVETARRNTLSDTSFERLLLLKANTIAYHNE